MDTTVEKGTIYEVVTHCEALAEVNFWVFEIPALGAVGQAMKLSQVADEARGIIAAWNESSLEHEKPRSFVHLTVAGLET